MAIDRKNRIFRPLIEFGERRFCTRPVALT